MTIVTNPYEIDFRDEYSKAFYEEFTLRTKDDVLFFIENFPKMREMMEAISAEMNVTIKDILDELVARYDFEIKHYEKSENFVHIEMRMCEHFCQSSLFLEWRMGMRISDDG